MNPRYLLRFETGERRGEEVPIDGARVKIGRRSVNDVTVIDPSVSGEHAELLLTGDEIELADCGSTNGVRVGGRRVSRCELRPGDVFALGNVKLRLLDATASGPAPALVPAAHPPGAVPPRAGADPAGPVIEEFDEPDVDAGAGASRPAPAALPDTSPGSEYDLTHTTVIGAEEIGEGVGTVSADSVEKAAGRRSVVGLAAGVLLVAVGGFVAWRQWGAGESTALRSSDPVPTVAGNLLTNGAFEGEGGGWDAREDASVPFTTDEVWRHTGLFGLGVDLRAGEWSAVRSPQVRVRPRRALVASGFLSVEGQAGARLGLRLESSTQRAQPLELWSAPIVATAGFERFEFAVDVPSAFDRAQLTVDAGVPGVLVDSGEGVDDSHYGLVSFDDAALVLEERERGMGIAFEEFRLLPVGEPAARVLLVHIDRILVDARIASPSRGSGVDASSSTGTNTSTARFAGHRGALAVRPAEQGGRLEISGAPSGAQLVLRVDPALAAGGVATTGPGGYRAHTLTFEESRASSVLLGSGLDLVRLGFEQPLAVRGRSSEAGFELELSAAAAKSVELQLTFVRDRGEAQQLARGAREQEADGRLGAAMNTWAELLNTYPFDATLVREAEDAGARLLESGLGEVQELRREMERARFFGLAALPRRSGERTAALAERYADTEVAFAALALSEEIQHDLAGLERGTVARNKQRLAVIAGLLERDAPRLAERVRVELQRAEGDG